MELKTHGGIQIKELDKKGEGRAVFATLNVVDKDDDVTLPGAFGEQVVPMVPTHDWHQAPIGKGRVHEEKDEALFDFQMNLGTEAGKTWYNALKFDLEHPPAKQEYSYGYHVKEFSLGEHDGRRVRFLKRMQVHEVSPVLVGAGVGTYTHSLKGSDDPALKTLESALVAYSALKNKSRLEITAELAKRAAVDQEVIYRVLSGDLALNANIINAASELFEVDVDKPIKSSSVVLTQKIIPGHSSSTKDGVWDGPANERRVSVIGDVAYFKRIYAWLDPAEDELKKSAWKFIHHYVKDNTEPGEASIRACITGIAILNGAKGGTTIPEADRRGIWDHLAHHLEDAEVAPPVLRSADDISSKLSDVLTWFAWDVEALINRVKEVKEMRSKDERELPENRLAQIADLHKLMNELDKLIKKPSIDGQALELVHRFQTIKHRTLDT